MNKRIYLKLLLALGTVHDKVRTIQHKISYLITLCAETCSHQLKNQPAKATTRYKHQIILFEVLLAFLQYFGIVILLFALFAPFPIKLFDCCLDFRAIISCGLLVRGKIFSILSIVDILYELIEKRLIMIECVFHHEGFSLLIVSIIGVVLYGLIKIAIFLPHISCIVEKCALNLFFVLLLLVLAVVHSLVNESIAKIYNA